MSGDKQKETIERTSKLLLSGWKMLALSCPICNTALMQSKVGEKQCPSCNLPVVSEGEIRERKVEVASSNISNIEEVRESYDDLRAKYEKDNKKQSQTSSLIGQKLLQGWTMLEQCCPDVSECRGTPLMRESIDGPSICVCCNKSFNVSHGLVVPISTKSMDAIEADSAKLSTNSIADWDNKPILNFAKRDENERDLSSKISQKLLQGWAMLDKSCISGNCSGDAPLLRDREGKEYCVECGYVTSQKDKLTNISRGSAYVNDETESDDEIAELEASVLVDSLVQKALIKSSNVSSAEEVRKPLPQKAHVGALQVVGNLVVEKLLHSAELLQTEQDVLKCGELADLITKLASAIKAVKSIEN